MLLLWDSYCGQLLDLPGPLYTPVHVGALLAYECLRICQLSIHLSLLLQATTTARLHASTIAQGPANQETRPVPKNERRHTGVVSLLQCVIPNGYARAGAVYQRHKCQRATILLPTSAPKGRSWSLALKLLGAASYNPAGAAAAAAAVAVLHILRITR
jgi:hypothetical protein